MDVAVTQDKKKAEAQLQVVVTADELLPFIKEAAKHLSKNLSIKGFRPGKAPFDVVEEHVGYERLMHETGDRAVPHFFVQAVIEEEVEAISRPAIAIKTLSRDEGLAFTATVQILPEVTFGDLSTIEIEKREVTVGDEEIEKELEHIAKTRSTFIDVARPAEKGDTVTVDFTIMMNGTLMEGGESKNHPVHLGEGHFVEDFENKLQGVVAGEDRQFEIHFPEDFARESLRGKKAEAQVKVHSVQKRVLPKLDDDFAKSLGQFTSLDDLKNKLRKNMQAEKEQRETDRRQSELSQKLAEIASFSALPDALIEKEIDRQMDELNQMLAVQQKTVEDYLKEAGKTLADARSEMRPRAEESVRIGLALRAFAEQEHVEVDEEAVAKDVQAYLQQFGSPEVARKQVDPEELRERVTHMFKNKKTLEKLEESVTIKDSKVK